MLQVIPGLEKHHLGMANIRGRTNTENCCVSYSLVPSLYSRNNNDDKRICTNNIRLDWALQKLKIWSSSVHEGTYRLFGNCMAIVHILHTPLCRHIRNLFKSQALQVFPLCCSQYTTNKIVPFHYFPPSACSLNYGQNRPR